MSSRSDSSKKGRAENSSAWFHSLSLRLRCLSCFGSVRLRLPLPAVFEHRLLSRLDNQRLPKPFLKRKNYSSGFFRFFLLPLTPASPCRDISDQVLGVGCACRRNT